MTNPAIAAKAIDYFNKMFNNKELERKDDMCYVSMAKLMKITTNIDGNEPHQYRLTFLEQNPDKPSYYGQKAREGAKIMWVIAFNRANRKERWLGRVEDGVWHPK